MNKRTLIGSTALMALLSAAGAPAADEAWPSKPIRMVVGYAPGGGTDILARLMGQRLASELGQTVIIDNKPGAGQNIGASFVARAPADGYTLFLSSSALAINVSLYNNLDYDPIRSFVPVAMFGQSPNLMVVPASLGVKSVAEFVAYAKKNENKINFSSSGAGSSQHLGGEMFKQQAGIQASHIAYRGSAPSITAILGGEVQYTFINIPSVTPLMKSDKLRVLAITSDKRSPVLPEVPTMAEAGMPGMVMAAWYGILAPAGTPPAVVERLNAAVNQAVADPGFRAQMEKQGAEPISRTPAYFARFLAEDIARWAPVVKTGDVRPE
jgi:tripartite-type tricarboxylate transporter receptor subunit TctC